MIIIKHDNCRQMYMNVKGKKVTLSRKFILGKLFLEIPSNLRNDFHPCIGFISCHWRWNCVSQNSLPCLILDWGLHNIKGYCAKFSSRSEVAATVLWRSVLSAPGGPSSCCWVTVWCWWAQSSCSFCWTSSTSFSRSWGRCMYNSVAKGMSDSASYRVISVSVVGQTHVPIFVWVPVCHCVF